LQWIVAPIVIRGRQTISLHPRREPVNPEMLTPEFRELVAEVIPQFAAEGFELAAGFHQPDTVPGVVGIGFLLVNRRTQDIAQVFGTQGKGSRSLNFTVRSQFNDDTHVITGYRRTMSQFPRHPSFDSQAFPWVRDAHTLCELHRRRLARRGKADQARVAPAAGDELAYFQRESDQIFAWWQRVGYVYPVPETGVLRFTWKGAFLSCWKLSNPIKRWRMQRRDRWALAEWRELGMDQWRSPHMPSPPMRYVLEGVQPSATAGLGYEIALAPNQVREEPTATELVVRVGAPTVGRYFADHWPTLVSAAFWCTCLGLIALVSWSAYALSPRLLRRGGASFPTGPIVLPVLFLCWDLYKLIRGMLGLRGTTVLTANGHGLSFRNVPAFSGSGQFRRDEIRSLHVVLHRAGFRPSRRLYRLLVSLESGRSQTLLIHPDAQELNRLRTRLAEAMGIESAGVGEGG
jgi:hypothetical protein